MSSTPPLLVDQVVGCLEQFAPAALAESWDNVGLLLGDRQQPVARVMTCLTLTEAVADEAIERQADCLVTHHPLLFRPVQRMTTETTEGRILWKLVRQGIAVYSPHTAFDSTFHGINDQLAAGLQLVEATPLQPVASDTLPLIAGIPNESLGTGRCGAVLEPLTLGQLAHHTGQLLGITSVRIVGQQDQPIRRVAVACGSGGSLLNAAIENGADVLVTGEASFHTLLAAEGAGVAMILTGHYASERFAVEQLAQWLAQEFPQLETWPSQAEHDPLQLLTLPTPR